MSESEKGVRENIKKAKRIVVKVGTSNIIKDGKFNIENIAQIVDGIVRLKKEGREVILVSSGAVASGVAELKLAQARQKLRDPVLKRATAAVGQNSIIELYRDLFGEQRQAIGQVLVTHEDFFERKRFLNVRNTLTALLGLGVVPVVNENDTVTVDEIKIGDNDNISALVAACVDADLLIILSDVDGVYTDDPRKNKQARLLKEIKINAGGNQLAVRLGRAYMGSGGLGTKLEAVKKATNSGIAVVIANGFERGILRRIIKCREVGTIFVPTEEISQRKQWLAFASKIKGTIVIDKGAKEAIERGKSLLPIGVANVKGVFDKKSVIGIADEKGEVFSKGITNYSSDELAKIKGKQTSQVNKILGNGRRTEVVHRKDMIFLYKL